MAGAPRLFVYDFDGTLVDSARTSYECYAEVFQSLGIAFDRARFEETYSPDWYRTYRALGLPESRWDEADRMWTSCYARRDTPLVEGALAALRKVQARERKQALVTSGSRDRVRRELDRHGLAGMLEPVVCCEDVARKKPHPEGLERVLGELGVEAGDAAYFGDSPEDVEMARAAGVAAVAIPGGFPNRAALEATPYDLLAETLDEAVTRCLDGRL